MMNRQVMETAKAHPAFSLKRGSRALHATGLDEAPPHDDSPIARLEPSTQLLGASRAMRQVRERIARLAGTDTTLLITGERGTGKELAATLIHALSGRRALPFLTVDLSTIPAARVERELFGEEAAGGRRQHRGCLERSRGTVLLRELGRLSPEAQARLARVIDRRAVRRLGADHEVPLAARLLIAVRSDAALELSADVDAELAQRLAPARITLPRLCEREDDVMLLAPYFIALLNRRGHAEKRLGAAAITRLREHDWPGNVRELRFALERSWLLSGELIEAGALALGSDGQPAELSCARLEVQVGSTIEAMERKLILASLDHFGGNKVRAAEVLGISLKTLYNRLNQYRAEGRAQS
jgi:DNA-binding NtrC family response regulator